MYSDLADSVPCCVQGFYSFIYLNVTHFFEHKTEGCVAITLRICGLAIICGLIPYVS